MDIFYRRKGRQAHFNQNKVKGVIKFLKNSITNFLTQVLIAYLSRCVVIIVIDWDKPAKGEENQDYQDHPVQAKGAVSTAWYS